ncbi:hypothetical protein TPA0910_33250 [Streptomyces hygroscopicus subsp. sporocinereus]|uniref:Uncharacterized protein n=1 Tax=Streptomyces hygroscopicus TaxID=1912 RepID=A0ABQ3TZT7_STRHY|nr:hypothetical protein TPA0910_33250 [Streptomyces hygroscopicus]
MIPSQLPRAKDTTAAAMARTQTARVQRARRGMGSAPVGGCDTPAIVPHAPPEGPGAPGAAVAGGRPQTSVTRSPAWAL